MLKIQYLRRRAEDGLKARERTHDGIAHHRSDQARNQRLNLEILRVENLRADNRSGERCFEDCGDARSQSRGQRDVAFPRGELQCVGDAGTRRSADLCDGSLSS